MFPSRVRIFALFTILLLALFAVTTTPSQTAFAQSGIPNFSYQGVAVSPGDLSFNPTGEIIFPSVIKASDYFSNPLGEYYLYYAPHDAPGGISLAYSNSINGPWTEYSNNPLIPNNWQPFYNVSHVSSPHIIWNSSENKMFMYFHGENNTTRLATTTDGINFNYDSKVVGCSDLGWNSCQVSYARVYEHTIPSKGNKYLMLLMGQGDPEGAPTGRKIYYGWSNNGRDWTFQQSALLSPQSNHAGNLAGPSLLKWNGCTCVAFHASSGNIFIADVGSNFDKEIHLGVLFDDPTGAKSGSPDFITVNNKLYMFYRQGPRLSGRIGYAVEDDGTLGANDTVIDNNASSGVTVTGSWSTGSSGSGFIGSNYFHDGNNNKGKKVKYAPNLSAGTYNVYARWTSHPNRATNVPYKISHANGNTNAVRNQQSGGGSWIVLGTFEFSGGSSGSVEINTSGTNGYVIADAIRFEKISGSQSTEDVYVDNSNGSNVSINGGWSASTGSGGFYGSNYLHDQNSGKGSKSVKYTPNLAGGTYNVYGRWTAHPNRASNVPFVISHANGTSTVTKSQKSNGGQWVLLGTYSFNSGSSGFVQINTSGTNGYVIADAVRFEQQP